MSKKIHLPQALPQKCEVNLTRHTGVTSGTLRWTMGFSKANRVILLCSWGSEPLLKTLKIWLLHLFAARSHEDGRRDSFGAEYLRWMSLWEGYMYFWVWVWKGSVSRHVLRSPGQKMTPVNRWTLQLIYTGKTKKDQFSSISFHSSLTRERTKSLYILSWKLHVVYSVVLPFNVETSDF